MTTHIYPVILAGGSGTRLWPLSRQNFPKQFLALNGALSLLQQTLKRVETLAPKQIILVSNEAHYFLCQEQAQSIETPLSYVLEPCVRNTAPAIASVAHHLLQTVGPEAMMLVLPSDHWIADDYAWQESMLIGAQYAAEHPSIVTFGIQPDSPKTGYGYIESGPSLTEHVHKVTRFREKPSKDLAAEFLQQGNYYWNSGMFVCSAAVYLEELLQFEPEIYHLSKKALNQAQGQHDYLRLDASSFEQCTELSIDYAIMEKTSQAVVIPVSMPWSDLGCWTAVAESNPQDKQQNTIIGKALVQDSHNCLINSEHILVTTLGIQNQIIIATGDAILVADKNYSQEVKELVQVLRKDHHHLTQDHQRVPRPWGYYEILAEGPVFKVKRLMVKPGAKLSLQMHQHRAEHWVVVSGEAEVVNKDKTFRLLANQSTYIPQQTRHRLSNPGIEPLYVIEVQSGSYLGEDDIQRFDDLYARTLVEAEGVAS